MSSNPFSDQSVNPYEPPQGEQAAVASVDAARLAARLTVQPVSILLMSLAALTLPLAAYEVWVHSVLMRDWGIDVRPAVAGDVAMALVALVILYGANEFRLLRSRRAAWLAVILACVPIFGPCLVLGIPVGIWGIVVLRRPEIKAAFEKP